MNDCVLFFVKYPEPGHVKTRLAKGSSPERAAEFYKGLVEDKLAGLSAGVTADLLVCFAPESMAGPVAEWLGPDRRYLGQKGSGLGRRMENAFREAFFMGYERAVLVGSDIPGLTPAIVNSALAGLTASKAALGPASDGGYYLIGFHRDGFVPEVFHTEQWGDGYVYERAFNVLADASFAHFETERLDDVDTVDDVETLLALGGGGPLTGEVLRLARKVVGR